MGESLSRPSGVALLTGILLAGCGSLQNASQNDASVIRQAQHQYELVCRETAQLFAVDPIKARSHVPAGYTIYITGQPTTDASRRLPDGKSVFIMIYQECSTATWDGIPLAPLMMLHQWIRIEGPHEILPVPGTATTIPTYYWYMLDDPTTHKGLRDRFREGGIRSSKVDFITLGHDIDGVRIGGVVEKDNPGKKNDVGYSFVENNSPSEQVPVGINHRLVHEECDDNGRCTLMKALDSGFIIPFGSGSPVTMTAHPESSVARLWGATTLHGVATQFEYMEFNVRISSGIPLANDNDNQDLVGQP